ncbi:competence protein CoiA family protein [uncultured Photobacterium sp.]|uniref:competence protein CoiA family protein n=1 Tax=uncultured Photobacterium sp. TaxID=173973 RepID=UPI00262826BC|nr:competence protein CoiA family protein [uncultured Photobacterium sp.]
MKKHKSILMTRAFNDEGKIVPIHEVERGRACHCTCIVCGSGLIAKKGDEKKHHFAHDVDCTCDWTGETELHLLAKEVLQNDKKVSFTHLALDGVPYKINVPFISVEQEVQLGHLKPDIMGTTADGDSILIEICVTHPCEEAKIHHYRKQGMNAIEIALPPTLLDDVQVLDLNFVRRAINAADIRCISLNPLSEFCKRIAEHNQRVISKQGDELRSIRKEIRDSQRQFNQLSRKKSELQNTVQDWEVVASDIYQRAQQYRHQLNQEIESQQHVREYRKAKKNYDQLSEQLQRDYDKEVAKANEDIEKYEENLRKKARDHILNREVTRLRNEVERLETLRKELRVDGRLLSVDEYIQKLDARYENRFTELENNWLVLERLRPELQKPDFVKPENRRLPDLPIYNKYKQVRG